MKLCDVNPEAEQKLPPLFPDKSGIGVHYVSAFIKPMNATLEDGTVVTCRRRGLKLTLAVGEKTGEGLLRRIETGPDPRAILAAALDEAAANAGVKLTIKDGEIRLD